MTLCLPTRSAGEAGPPRRLNEFVDDDGTPIGKVCVWCLRVYSEVTCVYPLCRVTRTLTFGKFRKVSFLSGVERWACSSKTCLVEMEKLNPLQGLSEEGIRSYQFYCLPGWKSRRSSSGTVSPRILDATSNAWLMTMIAF